MKGTFCLHFVLSELVPGRITASVDPRTSKCIKHKVLQLGKQMQRQEESLPPPLLFSAHSFWQRVGRDSTKY